MLESHQDIHSFAQLAHLLNETCVLFAFEVDPQLPFICRLMIYFSAQLLLVIYRSQLDRQATLASTANSIGSNQLKDAEDAVNKSATSELLTD